MLEIVLGIGGLTVLGLGGIFLVLNWNLRRGQQVRFEKVMQRMRPVIEAMEQGQPPCPEDVKRLAGDPLVRNNLLDACMSAGILDAFPEEFRTPEKIAESDMVFWLLLPNELDAEPDEIELMGEVRRQVEGPPGGEVRYFVFRFRTTEPHWAAKDGWMAGTAGPYVEAGGYVWPPGEGTFSQFEPADSKSPEEHSEFSHQLCLEHGIYPSMVNLGPGK